MDFSNPDLKELACLIYETLRSNGIKAVLVGGACVSIYSHNRYQSSDLDFATYEEIKINYTGFDAKITPKILFTEH